MKLQHTLGGLEGLDPIPLETRVFVQDWEQRIFGIHTAMMALSPQLDLEATPSTFSTIWTWADLRKGAEGMNPFDYFKFRYYEKWLGGISGYFVDKGYITQEELETRTNAFLKSSSTPLPQGGDPKIDARVRKYLLIGDDPKRSLDAYLALKMRIWADVRPEGRDNPLAPLVRLAGQPNVSSVQAMAMP